MRADHCMSREAVFRLKPAVSESLRAAHRLLKFTRSLADLEQANRIRREHLAEGPQYRPTMPQPVSLLGQINQRRLPHLSLPPILNLAHLLQGLIHRRLIR
ncbi:hypothetical protein DJ480_17575 [Pseudomonas sp. Leaf98]|nr:hypothetical protein DJ480_17575 [Pseudomonas sp. Leaf98]